MEELKARLLSVFGRKFLGFTFISSMVVVCIVTNPEFYKFTMQVWLIAFGIFAGVSTYQKLKVK